MENFDILSITEGGIGMSGIKNQSDKVIGSVKEKVGDLLHNQTLKEEGKEQMKEAKAQLQKEKERIEELEDSYDELAARNQDLTKEQSVHKAEDPLAEHVSQSPHISPEQQREEIRMKHYTGIEEKK
ncbi:hypothetical protein RV11_GL001214 [Enterococcus phoeniculicola]|jgi:uncharacterized protein YjbJ (UPF0337 family)|nr:hypothetical protein RV11_GL001214 [Enterococcus phoeniculicola]